MREHFYSSANKQYNAWVESSEAFKKKVEEVAAKFHNQYQNIVLTEVDYQNSELLQERLKKGADYFEQQLSETFTLLTKTALETNNKMVKERLDNLMQNFNDLVKFKVLLLHYVAHNGLMLQPYLQAKAKISLSLDDNEKEVKSKEDRGKSKEIKEKKPKVTMEMKQEKALAMYLDGKLVEDIAKDMGVVESTVYSYLLPSVLNGKLPLNHLFEQKKIDAVNKCLDANPTATAKEVVEALGREDYGYGIVKCCMAVRGRM
jgi:transposase